MDTNPKILERLQEWYVSMCNDDWEHNYGVFISNIDNPGWAFKVELQDTYLYRCDFKSIKIQREHEHDWVICQKNDSVFQGYSGPKNLGEMIEIFLNWAETNK